MPLYEFENKKGEVTTLFFDASKAPRAGDWITIKRKKWKRIYSRTNLVTTGLNTDPFDEGAFVRKTGNVSDKGAKVGDLWDRAQEMSEKRAKIAGGKDPIKEKYLKEYSAKRKGKPHPTADKDKTYTI